MNSVEYVYIAEKILKNCISDVFQHLQNKIQHQKQELVVKEFTQGLTHCSPLIRSLCKSQLSSVNAPISKIMSSKLASIISNSSWFMLLSFKSLVEYLQLDDVYSCIILRITSLLEAIQKHEIYSCTYFNILLKIFVLCIEKGKHSGSTTLSPSKTEEHLNDENTLKTSLDNIRICRSSIKESVQGYSKLEKKLLEILIKVKAINLKYIVKALLCINSNKIIIKTCLMQRAKIYENDKLKILNCLILMQSNDKESIEFILSCYLDAELKATAIKILQSTDPVILKEISNELIQKDVFEGVLGLGYCCKYEIDNEILEQLLQCIDNSHSYLSYLGVVSLNNILKPIDHIKSQQTINILALLSEIIIDRTQLIKNFPEMKKKYLKCSLRVLKILKDFKRIVVICENHLSNKEDHCASLIYKFLAKLQINRRYFDRFRQYFYEGIYGHKGKYALEIAGVNVN